MERKEEVDMLEVDTEDMEDREEEGEGVLEGELLEAFEAGGEGTDKDGEEGDLEIRRRFPMCSLPPRYETTKFVALLQIDFRLTTLVSGLLCKRCKMPASKATRV